MRQFYAIIGHPVAHSLSPKFQQAAFDAIGIDAAYLPFDLSPDNLGAGLSALRTLKVSGFNITLPHKETMLQTVDRMSDIAKDIGAINTVVANQGSWTGDNTDGPGFLKALDQFLEKNGLSSPSHVLVFGAGGSARAVLWALARRHVTDLCLVNRTLSRGKELLSRPFLSKIPHRSPFAILDPAWKRWIETATSPLLINTLSLHAFKSASCSYPPLSGVPLSECSLFDLSYVGLPSEQKLGVTPFLQMGIPYRIPLQNGLGMLLFQGAEAFELWTDRKAPIETMEKVLLESTGQKDLWKSL